MGRTQMKAVFYGLITALTMIPAIVTAADEKPASFFACMQSDTAETREQIFTACERSAQTSNVARYTIDMTLRMKERNANSDGQRRELQSEAIAQTKPHYYYGGLAYMRQAELIEKVESEQGKPKNTARYCWFIQEAWRQMASASGDFNDDLEGRKRKTIVRSNACEKLPRQTFNASETIPDTGDLMMDIAELNTCLGPVTPDTMFDILYACRLAASKADMLAFRKAGGGISGPMSGGSS